MTQASFLPTLRELVRAYQAFEMYSCAHIRTLDLTPSQFDIIATLGNTPGMPLNPSLTRQHHKRAFLPVIVILTY